METNQKTHTIELTEHFSVPVEKLFQAWTEEEQLKQWWHPMDDSLENVTNELQEGGAIVYEFQSKDFRVSGNYKEAEMNKKLVYSWDWEFKEGLENENYTLTIEFESEGSGSVLRVKQDGLHSDEAIKPHKDAWEIGLQSLKAHLEKSSGTGENDLTKRDNLKSDEGMNDRSGGYNESPEQAKVGGG